LAQKSWRNEKFKNNIKNSKMKKRERERELFKNKQLIF
jgi:hypothetical protein